MPGSPSIKPHPNYVRLLGVVSRQREGASAWAGTVYRSVTPRYAASADLTSGFGARKNGGRWNPPGSFPAVYGSSTPETAVAESLATFRYYGIAVADALPRIVVAIAVRLEKGLDLTAPSVRSALTVSRRALRQERWREIQDRGEEALTQAIGRAAHEAGFDGLRAPSAPVASGWNLVVFPQRAQTSALRVVAEQSGRLPAP